MNSYYSKEELCMLGLKSYGDNVLISRKASIYAPHKISIGDNVRIDDFCLLSGEIELGNNILKGRKLCLDLPLLGYNCLIINDYCVVA